MNLAAFKSFLAKEILRHLPLLTLALLLLGVYILVRPAQKIENLKSQAAGETPVNLILRLTKNIIGAITKPAPFALAAEPTATDSSQEVLASTSDGRLEDRFAFLFLPDGYNNKAEYTSDFQRIVNFLSSKQPFSPNLDKIKFMSF